MLVKLNADFIKAASDTLTHLGASCDRAGFEQTASVLYGVDDILHALGKWAEQERTAHFGLTDEPGPFHIELETAAEFEEAEHRMNTVREDLRQAAEKMNKLLGG